jgi:DNA-directed RNA polymerase subunit RPC12/RpoP
MSQDDLLQCIDCQTLYGVAMRWPGYGQKLFPRCEACGERLLIREEENIARNFPGLRVSPSDFDPADAGERMDEDDP